MSITTLQVQGSDAAKKTVPLDTPAGKTYSAPIHKVGFGAESSLSLVSSDNPLPVTVESAELPSGAATSANQTTANEILASIEGEVSTAANQAELISNVGDVTNSKVQTDTNGTILGFLRGIVSWFSELIGAVVQTPTQAKAIRVQIGPGDIISYLPVFVDYPHHQVHEGEAFIFSDLQTGGLNVAATRDIRVSVGALEATTRTPHLIIEFIADSLAEIELYEGTTWTSGGTAQVAYNRNRNVADDSGTLYVNGATALTVNAIGTPVWKGMTTGTKNSAGGTDRGAYEFVLKASTEYCVRVTSRTTGLKFLTRLEYYKDLGV